ncbi:MAG: glycine cleavage system aminomethyltransferase GcvT [Gemmatimonadetes bacterium]|nr:glycine cleavage system aminomethyltransferase GcvT [Gemmatimonadota bacterium]
MTESSLSRTPLHDEHVALHGKMVPFAGFSMPVQYPLGITGEHRAVRSAAGLFDVSHMGEFEVAGPDALALVQRVTINDAARVEVGQAQYSAMVDERGGILDDLIIYRRADRWMLVVNASNREKDWAWVVRHAEDFDVELSDRSDEIALLALQGPGARAILQRLTDTDLDGVGYYRFAEGSVAGAEGILSGTGYTGEDGFELYLPAESAVSVWRALLAEGEADGLVPAGLGARDSLRLEMGYALYGNDLDEDHTPLEAGLGWITKLDQEGGFVGREALAAQKAAGVERRLVGLKLEARGFPRPGYDIVHGGEAVGRVTSGTLSPMLGQGVAMGYVPIALAKAGTELAIDIRGRAIAAIVQRPPFYTEGSIRR